MKAVQRQKPDIDEFFVQLPKAILYSGQLTHADKIVWAVLFSHDFKEHRTQVRKGWVRLSYETISHEAHIARRQVMRCIERLEAMRLILCERSENKQGANTYSFLNLSESKIGKEFEAKYEAA